MTARLDRFVEAQASVFDQAMDELRHGRKRTHWMWFIFPQARFLGRSATAQRYGLVSLAETRAYLAHPLLGDRLRRATHVAATAPAASLNALFGAPDDLKFRSCMTLFAAVPPDEAIFQGALDQWDEAPDEATLARVRAAQSGPDRL